MKTPNYATKYVSADGLSLLLEVSDRPSRETVYRILNKTLTAATVALSEPSFPSCSAFRREYRLYDTYFGRIGRKKAVIYEYKEYV